MTISTLKQPINFFHQLIVNNQLEEQRNTYFKSVEHYYGALSFPDKDYAWFDQIEVGITNGSIMYEANVQINYSDVLKRTLERELELSKSLLISAIAEISFNGNDTTPFLDLQYQTIESLLLFKTEWKIKYPFMQDFLLNLKGYINNLMSNNQSKENYSSNETNNPLKQITAIFSYLNSENELNQKILADNEYQQMIEDLVFMATNRRLPDSIIPITSIYTKQTILLYTFRVYNTYMFGKRQKPKFVTEYLQQKFTFFNNWETDTIHSKISQKPENFPSYVPQIVRRMHLEE